MATTDEQYVSVNEILPNLWLGNQACSQSATWVAAQGITLVINATKHIPCPHRGLVYYRVAVNDPGPVDAGQEDIRTMSRMLPGLVALIEAALARGHRILVHCHAGAQRSAIIVAALLASRAPPRVAAGGPRARMNWAVATLINKRPVAFFGGSSINFAPALKEYLLAQANG